MTGCDRYAPLLHGYADGELDAANVVDLEAHLAGCRKCQERMTDLRMVKDVIRESRPRFEVPAHLRARIERSIPAQRTKRGNHWALPAISGALAASLAMMLFVPLRTEVPIEDQLVQGHVRSMLADHLIDVRTSDEHVVRPWFNGKVDFAPRVPDLAREGFPLIGGRLDYIDGKVVPAIVYGRRRHHINLFVWPQQPGPPIERETEGYTIAEWSENNLRYSAVSDVGRPDLIQFRMAFTESAKGADGGNR
jgi:anti-sigma factor RsiW